MKVLRATVMGMCFGVLEALRSTRAVVKPESVTVLGELVHNEEVVDEINSRGFRGQPESDRQTVPSTSGVLITAHGVSEARRSALLAAKKTLIDTTCPLVRHAHNAARELAEEGRHVLVIGKRGHVEVQGIVEDLQSFSVLESPSEVETFDAPLLGVICQTTTRPETAAEILTQIRQRNPKADIRSVDTICQPTRDRQVALDRLADRVDVMVVVGGKSSNNSRQLAARARAHGCPAYLVQSAADIRTEWFSKSELVGLTAGTSTPDETIDDVYDALERLSFRAPG